MKPAGSARLAAIVPLNNLVAWSSPTPGVERRKESPAIAGLSLGEEPSNMTFIINQHKNSAAGALAM
jgi:hypothetical protein